MCEAFDEVTFVAANADDFAKIDFTKPLLGQMGYDEIEIGVDPAWEDFGKINREDFGKINHQAIDEPPNVYMVFRKMKLDTIKAGLTEGANLAEAIKESYEKFKKTPEYKILNDKCKADFVKWKSTDGTKYRLADMRMEPRPSGTLNRFPPKFPSEKSLTNSSISDKITLFDEENDYEEYLQGKTIFMPNEVKVIKKYKDDDEFWKRIDSMLKGDRNKLRISLTDDIFVTMNGDQVYRRQVGSITFYTFTMPSKDIKDIQPNLDEDDDEDDEDDDEDE
jgi:hypothetical protein